MEYLERKMDEINSIYENLNSLFLTVSQLETECLAHFTNPPASLSSTDTEQIISEVSDILEQCSDDVMNAREIFLSATPL